MNLSMSNGPHFVVTKAWDKSEANFVSNRNITVHSGTPGETCPVESSFLNIYLPTRSETTTTSCTFSPIAIPPARRFRHCGSTSTTI
jgi:hypothetical protein